MSANVFIDCYETARKLAPPRFMSIKMHPDRYKELYILADIPESIQVGSTLGPVGRKILRVHCIKPPMGVADGMAIIQDMDVPKDQLTFLVHGQPVLVYEGLAL